MTKPEAVELPNVEAEKLFIKMYNDFDSEIRKNIIDIAFEINNLKSDLKECSDDDKHNDIVKKLAYLFMREAFLEILLGYVQTECERVENNHKGGYELVIIGRRPDLYDDKFRKFIRELKLNDERSK